MHVASGRAGLCSWKLYGDPELSISSRKLESFRHDTGHDIRLIIDDYGLPDDLRISTELSFPQAVTQDRHLRLSRKPFGAVEPAAQCRCNAENREKVGSRLYSVEPFRCSFPGQIESIPEVCREILKGIRLLFPIQVIPRGYVGVWIAQTRIFFPHRHEAVRLMKGKRLEKNSIDSKVNPGFRPIMRTAYCRSRTTSSTRCVLRISRHSSLRCSTPPMARSAAYRASAGVMPAAMFCSANRSM